MTDTDVRKPKPESLWHMPPEAICPKARVVPAPCDCGFVGRWEARWTYEWFTPTDRPRSYSGAALAGGWWVVDGWEERCPECHDIERFNLATGEQTGRERPPGGVIVPLRPPARAEGVRSDGNG